MAADSASALELGDAFWQLASALGLGEQEYGGSGPRAKLQMVSWGVDSVMKTTQFTEAGAELNLLRYCDVRLRSTASGIRCWGLLIDAAQRRHSSPTDEAALVWPSFVSPVRTFVSYVADMGKLVYFWDWTPGGELEMSRRSATDCLRRSFRSGRRVPPPEARDV